MAVRLPELPTFALAAPDESVARRRMRDLQLDVAVPAGVLALIVLGCFVGPALFHISSPLRGSLLAANLPPLSPHHLLGTDALGDDVLSRCLFGGRVSIEVGVGSVGLGLLVGSALGVTAGYSSGVLSAVIMRVLDMFLAFPSLVIAATVATYLGANERNVIFAIAFFTVPAFARLSRAATLRERDRDFVSAARVAGRPPLAIVVRHILPNIAPQLTTFVPISVAGAILIEAALSFLGLSVPPPQPTWGGMIAAGQNVLSSEAWLILAPGAFLFVTVLSLNLLGDALRLRWAQQ